MNRGQEKECRLCRERERQIKGEGSGGGRVRGTVRSLDNKVGKANRPKEGLKVQQQQVTVTAKGPTSFFFKIPLETASFQAPRCLLHDCKCAAAR